MPTHKSRRRPQKSVKAKQKRTRKQRGSGDIDDTWPESMHWAAVDNLDELNYYLTKNTIIREFNGTRKPMRHVLEEIHNGKNALNMVFLNRAQTILPAWQFQRRTRECRPLNGINWHVVYALVAYGFNPHDKSYGLKETPFQTLNRCYKSKHTIDITRKALKPILDTQHQYTPPYTSLTEEQKGKILNAFFPQEQPIVSNDIMEEEAK